MNQYLFKAFLMTVAAGGALIAGGISAMLVRRMRKSWFPFILSFTGGIMLYAAFVKFLPSSEEQLKQILSSNSAFSVSTICFFVGVFATTPIDTILSLFQRNLAKNAHHKRRVYAEHNHELLILIFLSITFHNLFEGAATFLTYLSESYIAIPVVLALIAHNFPEGAVSAMVIHKRTGNKWKAILFCCITALTEPIGALLAYWLLHDNLSPLTFGLVKGLLAGLLVNTALDELIPSAELKGSHQLSMRGIIIGMGFMALLMVYAYR